MLPKVDLPEPEMPLNTITRVSICSLSLWAESRLRVKIRRYGAFQKQASHQGPIQLPGGILPFRMPLNTHNGKVPMRNSLDDVVLFRGRKTNELWTG